MTTHLDVALYRAAHGRTCDKGDRSNISVIAWHPALYPLLVEQVTPEAVAEIAHNCPSGAIAYERLDSAPQENAPKVNLVRIRENGPLAFQGDLRIAGQTTAYRATLCRCGASKNKPLRDGSHVGAGFAASGEAPTQESAALAQRDGAVVVKPARNARCRSGATSK